MCITVNINTFSVWKKIDTYVCKICKICIPVPEFQWLFLWPIDVTVDDCYVSVTYLL